MPRLSFILINLLHFLLGPVSAQEFNRDIKPLLVHYCADCHSGDEPNGDVDFTAINTQREVEDAFEVWESAVEHLRNRTMPPKGERQPTDDERTQITRWYADLIENVEEKPAVFRPRRLSVTEYRNTIRTVFGFDLEVAIIEAEQTRSERSLVVKLLPVDPPGKSGFKNDTHENPLTTVVWDQYGYLTRFALDELFSEHRRGELEAMTGPLSGGKLSPGQALKLLERFARLTKRRPVSADERQQLETRIADSTGSDLASVVRLELEALLLSPTFIYRGLLVDGRDGEQSPVDGYELAERLSYFLWADMPDEQLQSRAENEQLVSSKAVRSEVARMLASPKAKSLSEVFATEWLTLNEIEHVTDNLPQMLALKSQPIDFMNYLFTQNRPLLELIDSETAFINPHTRKMYGADAKQMQRYVKQRGIEVEAVPNQMVELKATEERGGILTMPGILAMNRGPILRGTWMLERILGQPLPEPPPDVGQIPPNEGGKELTFRQRFEQHRSKPACAVCHDKIDPLGFALQTYGDGGQYLPAGASQSKKQKRRSVAPVAAIDTTGRLPSGESFADIAGLKRILTTSQRDVVVRNIVERTMSYALCRKLTIYDRPAVTSITNRMSQSNGTWHDLFNAITTSVPFRETIFPTNKESSGR